MQREVMRMNILITVSYYAPHISGLTNSIKNLAEGFAKKGYSVSVLTTQHKKNLALYQVINNVNVWRVPFLLQLQKGFIMPFYLFHLIKHIWNNDCMLINLPQAEGIFAAIIGRLFGKRVVSVYACEITLPKSFISPIIEQVLMFSHFVTLFLSHKVVALSDDYANHTKLLRHFRNKTVGVYPYIQKPVATTAFHRKDKKLRIGYMGRISAEKGLEYLLEAIPLLEKNLGKDAFSILIAGPKAVGEKQYIKKIEMFVEKYKEFVVLLPPLEDGELGSFYSSLDVLVLPSINSTEAFGMVQVEAMLCGTPVVCSDLPGPRVPVVKTGMGEIAKKKDSKDLAAKIVTVLKNKNGYVKKKKLVEDIFSPDKVLQSYETLLLLNN